MCCASPSPPPGKGAFKNISSRSTVKKQTDIIRMFIAFWNYNTRPWWLIFLDRQKLLVNYTMATPTIKSQLTEDDVIETTQKGEQRSNFKFSLHFGRMNMQQWFCSRAYSKASQNNCRTTATNCMPDNTTTSQRLPHNTDTCQCQLYSPGQLNALLCKEIRADDLTPSFSHCSHLIHLQFIKRRCR